VKRPDHLTRRQWARIRIRATATRGRDRTRRTTQRISTTLAQKGTLSIVGLGVLAGAGYTLDLTIGLIGTGLALLIIDGRIIP
jgi:hypothetical protein